MLDRVLAELRGFGPDVVVHDPFAPAGLVAARHLGVRTVLHQISLWDPWEVHGAALAALARHRRVPGDGRPDATLSITPAGLADVDRDSRIRAVPASGEGSLPGWLDRPPRRPRILVSRSTTNSGPGHDVVRRVVAAAPGLGRVSQIGGAGCAMLDRCRVPLS
ncbi:hypothetical protein [Pseudonocardia sp. HH130630-07]|uniref:hypothetical protein n=1 Tax=Pseudonocardia sp. HH130630-07 TaxID=1690815 RepID=UPI0008151DA0|nr:hypothetical protein [Pseudonocardia sp. HH130630-07]ANY08496.1 hypothetical protein AFB00_21985 [Pseudonocardia sp. HH130630-07]